MSAVLILTPVIVSSWPAIAAAVAGAATSMGFAAKESISEAMAVEEEQNSVEVEVEASEVLSENVATGQEIVLTKDNVELRVKRDERGRCTVCANGKGHSKAELQKMADEFSQKMVQCYTYNRVATELKNKGFQVVNEEMMEDEAVRIHVRRWED